MKTPMTNLQQLIIIKRTIKANVENGMLYYNDGNMSDVELLEEFKVNDCISSEYLINHITINAIDSWEVM